MGGWQGRALRRDDEIPLLQPLKNKALEDLAMDLWALKIYLPSALAEPQQIVVRLIKGQQWDEFTPASCAALLAEPYRISPDSERMGYRLQGAPLLMIKPRQMISEGTTFGSIQVPAGGQPIILMADRQTTGGYPKMAYVASVDLPRLAQMGPGDRVSFKAIGLEQAQALNFARAQAFATLAQALQPVRTLLLNH
jgi:allophanate hydrolase subunit 2